MTAVDLTAVAEQTGARDGLVGVDALTADGCIIRIRPVDPADHPGLAGLYGGSSPDSLRMRFFAQPTGAALTAEVDRLCRPTGTRYQTVVAEANGSVVGVASYERVNDTDRRAEFSIFVSDVHRGRGIGTLLLEHLMACARAHGITDLIGEVLPGNSRMLKVAHGLSAHTYSRFDDDIVDVGLRTAGVETMSEAVDLRDRTAERASLMPVFAPASVAVVGVGHRRGGVGHETLRAIRETGFTGRVYAVNRNGGVIGGAATYRSVTDLPAPVDLAVIAVPADQVARVLAEAAGVGVRGAVVLSSGFGEDGPEGRLRQAAIVRTARAYGVRLIGPNCLGIVNTDPAVRLNAGFAPSVPPIGGLAVASQSGGVGIAVLDSAVRTGLGISTFVSLGNKADVSGNDLIAYWFGDPATRAVALYLESFGNPRKFGRTVRALSRRKPVLAIKNGRSDAGQRAGASHTAAAAVPAATVDALFAQAGVVRVDTLGELVDAARVLTDQPLPTGNRLAVLGNAGGLNVLAADAAQDCGLTVPQLSDRARADLVAMCPGNAGMDNPIDLGTGASPAVFAAAAEVLADSGEADALLLGVIGTRANVPAGILAALGPVVDRHPELTVAAVVIGDHDDPPTLGERRAPVFDLPERAVVALGHAARYAAWRRAPLGGRIELPDVDTEHGRQLVSDALDDGAGWQPYGHAAVLLGTYGIPILQTITVHDGDAAVDAADSLGYPVVLKSADPDLVHKSDAGGVCLHLRDAAAVRDAYGTVSAAGRATSGVLVQRQIAAPVELVAGIVHDPLFGSLVMLGLGGVQTDVLGDRVLRLVPMTDLDAGRMWRDLRAAPLLTGFGGTAPVDLAALEDLLHRLGRLAEDLPELAELDLNPVLVGPDGVVAVNAKLRLTHIGVEPSATLRGLRTPG